MWQFNEHFTWKVVCMAKSTQAVDENMKLSKCAKLGRMSALSKANVPDTLKPLYAIY